MQLSKSSYQTKIILAQFMTMLGITSILSFLNFIFIENSQNPQNYMTRMGPLIFGVVLTSTISLHFILRANTGSIKKLIHAAKEISLKGRTNLIKINTGDEFELLGRSFNRMSHAITSQIQDLEKAHARLEEANQVKARFLANLSHELRTPLNAIKASSEFLVEDDEASEDTKEFSKIIFEGAQVLNEHLDHIYHLQGSLDTSQDNIERNFYLSDITDHLKSSIPAQFPHKALDFDVEIPPAVKGVEYHGYEHRLEVLLKILTENAFKFTDFGFVRIELSCEMLDRQKDILRFRVIDSGIGISASAQKEIFNPFHQLDDSDTKSHDGLGLGLALALNHAKFFGTLIQIESHEGKGSQFSFEVILERVEARLGEHPV